MESAITCANCKVSVHQPAGTRRTICPSCGHYFQSDNSLDKTKLLPGRPPASPNSVTSRSNCDTSCENKFPPLNKVKDEKQKTGGRLRTLTNFFQNLKPSNKNKSKPSGGDCDSQRATPGTQLPPISHSKDRVISQRSRHTDHHGNDSGVTSSRIPSGNSSKSRNSTRPPTSTGETRKALVHPHIRTVEDLRAEITEAERTGSWTLLKSFFESTFDCFLHINAAFKKDSGKEFTTPDDSDINVDFVSATYDALSNLPQELQRSVLKAVINSLLSDKSPHTKDDLRAYLILLQNPLFYSIDTFVIFAHLLRQMAALSDHNHHQLVSWIKTLQCSIFLSVVEKLNKFISVRLYPPRAQDLPPLTKCSWWIPSATKVMALFNAANEAMSPAIISHMAFYNNSLDHLDLMAEYYTWQNPSAHPGFSFCQYPFILSITAKRNILQRDSEQQMIITARRSLVAKVQRRQLPDIGMLFFNLTVRRTHIVSDSLNEISRKQHDLKKKLKVTFVGEPGLDMGGLTKEWFMLLIKQVFQREYGMFTYERKAGVYWLSTTQLENYQEFNLVGVLMGLAVYNSIILDIRFSPVCYRKLLSPAVVPYNNPQSVVGVTDVTLKDLTEIKPDLARGLQELLDYDGDVEADFGITFQISFEEFGAMKTALLKPGGDTINVTNKNRQEYVKLYVDYMLNKAVYEQFQAFYHGFHSVCASNALIMLRPEEVELLVCGSPNLDMHELKKVTTYDGYSPCDITVKHFWQVVLSMAEDRQKRLLLFTTGSDRIPIGGMSEMQFKITKSSDTNMLPTAHTCFNQLVLPDYDSRRALKHKLMIAIQNAEGFGIE